MKITILGGGGDVGSRIVTEAIERQHEVIAISRKKTSLKHLPTQVEKLALEITRTECIASAAKGSDLIISALRPIDGKEQLLSDITEMALNASTLLKLPIIIVGGAARLKMPDQNSFTVLTMPNFLPETVKAIAHACQIQFELCQNHRTASWKYISPPAMLLPGKRTGHYRRGKDTLLIDADGNSTISMEDFAVAILDEAEMPTPQTQAFTVAY